jgi:hypothetical protein
VQGFAAAARALAIDPVLLDAVDERNRRTSGEHR